MFGFIGLPQLTAPGSSAHELYEEAHELFAYALIVLVAVHVAAALYHHFVLRDAVLWRMLGSKPQR
jgi:cytochrome b561